MISDSPVETDFEKRAWGEIRCLFSSFLFGWYPSIFIHIREFLSDDLFLFPAAFMVSGIELLNMKQTYIHTPGGSNRKLESGGSRLELSVK